MTRDSDEQALLTGARRLDEQILGEIYTRYSTELFRYAVRLLDDTQAAEDCVAETFSRFLQALGRGGGPRQHLRAYLYRVAHNWIMDHFRRSPPETLALDTELTASSESDPGALADARLEQIRIRKALLKLTSDQRNVLVLRFLEGLSNEETAAIVGRSVGAVKALQHRGLEALRRLLEAEEQLQ